MGLLGLLGIFAIGLSFFLLFLGVGLQKGRYSRDGTSVSGPIFFILLVIGILMIAGDIMWASF